MAEVRLWRCLPFFSLKGWDNLAQGNALGLMTVWQSSLKGWDNKLPIDANCSTSQYVYIYLIFPPRRHLGFNDVLNISA
jgi:hypothetical protein